MELYTTEEEQVERIKKWLKEYGTTVIISILIVVIGTFGWRYWQSHRAGQRADASNYYEQLVNNIMSENTTSVEFEAKQLIKNYSNTPYAALAGLLLAKQYVLDGRLDQAEQQLTWVMKNASTNSLQQIARNRLAKLLIAQNKPEEGIELLKKIDDESYLAAIEIVRGDAYVAMKQTEKARSAYQAALAILPKNSDSRPLLEMKLSDLTR